METDRASAIGAAVLALVLFAGLGAFFLSFEPRDCDRLRAEVASSDMHPDRLPLDCH